MRGTQRFGRDSRFYAISYHLSSGFLGSRYDESHDYEVFRDEYGHFVALRVELVLKEDLSKDLSLAEPRSTRLDFFQGTSTQAAMTLSTTMFTASPIPAGSHGAP